MNCDDYRQAIGADPSFDGGGEHLSQCAGCRAYRDDMRSLEARIRDALSLPVPELVMPELAAPDADKIVSLRRDGRRPAGPWIAVAATVVIAAFVGVLFLDRDDPSASLPDQILEHIAYEQGSLRVTDEAVSDSRLASMVPASVAVMNHDAGLITYAQSCIINGHRVPHLVIQGERGPVTILLMPEEPLQSAIEFEGERVEGIIVPVGGGSIAIVGPSGENLQRIEHSVRNSVTWSA